ncbi:hypothetical protein ACTFIW_010569 [Dictyostelium discoideum]
MFKKVLGLMGDSLNNYMNPNLNNTDNNNNNNNIKNNSPPQQSTPQQQRNNNNNNDDSEDEDEFGLKNEIELFKNTLKVNNTSSSLDILIIRIIDKVNKNEFEEGLKLLKQFVYIVMEAISKPVVTPSTNDNNNITYNTIYEKYHIPPLNKIEELYQITRSKTEETMRTNNEQSVIQLSLILSIVQQIKYKLVSRSIANNQHQHHQNITTFENSGEEDEGLVIYIQFQRKVILQDSGPIIKDMLRINQQLSESYSDSSTNSSNDIKFKVKSIDNCLMALKKVLSSVVQKVSDSIRVGNDQWRWNDIILFEKYKTKLVEWNSNNLTLPLHNQSAQYLDQIYSIILEKLKDSNLLKKLTDANISIEDLINNFKYSQSEIELIQPLLGIDELLNQISSISEISERYISYIQTHCNTSTNKKVPQLNDMKSKIQEIMTNYSSFETQYFQLSFSFSIYNDDLRRFIVNQMNHNHNNNNNNNNNNNKNVHQSQQQQQQLLQQQQQLHQQQLIFEQENNTSSMVDNIFFVFRKVAGRAISSSNSPTTCAVINLTLANFDMIYMPYFENLLEYNYSDDFDKKRDIFLIILNNLTLTKEYIYKVKDQLKETTFLKFKDENDRKAITMCIEGNGDGFSTVTKSIDNIVKENIKKIVQVNSPSLTRLIWPFRNTNYEIGDEEFENYEINDPFAMDFLSELMALLQPYKRKFIAENFDQLIHLMSTFIAKTMEDFIMQKRFNQLGGIQLSKDIRKIIDFLCNITTEQNIRHKFTRLSQVVHLLTFDKVNDILEYWNQPDYKWNLNVLEIKLVLGRRSDFNVHNLNLK